MTSFPFAKSNVLAKPWVVCRWIPIAHGNSSLMQCIGFPSSGTSSSLDTPLPRDLIRPSLLWETPSTVRASQAAIALPSGLSFVASFCTSPHEERSRNRKPAPLHYACACDAIHHLTDVRTSYPGLRHDSFILGESSLEGQGSLYMGTIWLLSNSIKCCLFIILISLGTQYRPHCFLQVSCFFLFPVWILLPL